MPSSAVVTFSDPDEYAAAFRNAKVDITVIGRGQFTAELTSIDLHRLQMQRYHENLPRVVHWAGTSALRSDSWQNMLLKSSTVPRPRAGSSSP